MSYLNIRDLDDALSLDREALQTVRGGWSLPYLYQPYSAPGQLQSLNPQPLPPKESSLSTHGIIIVGG
jgi:hypothetical protein